MPQHHFIQRAAVLAAVTWITGTVQAAPATASFSANVQVLQAIEIREDFNLDFGKIDKPGTGSRTFIVNADGTTSITGGGTGGSFIGGHRPGQYDILGTANNAAVLITSGGTCSTNTIALSGLEIDLPVPVVLPLMNVKIGGRLTVTTSSQPGSHTCPYTITARYE